jgi:hypothetical protein
LKTSLAFGSIIPSKIIHNLISLSLIFSLALVVYTTIPIENQQASARCPNGYHKDQSGECEKVVNNKGKPRCPNGYHRSPDGDCEKVSGSSSSTSKKSNSNLVKSSTKDSITGTVTRVIDGDTLVVNGVTVRLSLVNTPETYQNGYQSAKDFVKDLCLGEKAKVDVDNGQPKDRYGRTVGLVYCNGTNLNQELRDNHLANILTTYCSKSEFANENWADC